jgi:DNA-binding IclR family transcriptional regulator
MEKYNDTKQTTMQSIDRAANILDCISSGRHSLTDIANHCHLGKSTAYRLLQALAENNLVAKDPISRQYYLGHLITHLISKPEITQQFLILCADEEIKRLAEFTGETVSFGLLAGLRYLNLQSYPSKYDLRVIEAPRKIGSVYAGAAGRALLSQLDRKELKRAMGCLKLEPITEFTNIDKEKVLDQLKLIQKQGYAISSNELTVGSMCLAAPVKNYSLPAVIYILAPESRLKSRTSEFLERLLYASERISYNITQAFRSK